MLETIVKTDAHIENSVSSTEIDSLVSGRLNYIGELYKQIAQIDFSKPVLEALLNYKEPDTLERDLLDMGYERTAIAMEIAKANSSQVLNNITVRPCKVNGGSIVEKSTFVEALMAPYKAISNANKKETAICAATTNRIANILYNFFSVFSVNRPVANVFHLRKKEAQIEVVATAVEMTRRALCSLNYEYFHTNNTHESILVDNGTDSFISGCINYLIDQSDKVHVNCEGFDLTDRDSIIEIIVEYGEQFIKSTKRDYNYIILNESLYYLLTTSIRSDVNSASTLFGKPIFKSTKKDNHITLGINPNRIDDYISGYPIIATNDLIGGCYTTNPVTFTPSFNMYSRCNMSIIGNLNKSVITVIL